MPSIIFNDNIKKKFEQIRGKFLSTGLFTSITRAETLELMIDILNFIDSEQHIINDHYFVEDILKTREEKNEC